MDSVLEPKLTATDHHQRRNLFAISSLFLLLATLVHAMEGTCKIIFSLSTCRYCLRKGYSSWGSDFCALFVAVLLSLLHWERFISQLGFSQLACILTRINWSYTKTAARGKKILHSSPDVQLPSAYDLCIGFDSQTSSIGSNLSQEHYFISDVCSIQIQENTFGFPLTKVRNTTSNTYLSFIKIW